MTKLTPDHAPTHPASAGALGRAPYLDGRLGIDEPSGWWISPPRLKVYEAAGFRLVQLRTPPRSMMVDPVTVARHATAVRAALDLTGLRVVIHAPDDLRAGTADHDRALAGTLAYAAEVGAELVVSTGRTSRWPTARCEPRTGCSPRSARCAGAGLAVIAASLVGRHAAAR